MNYKKRVFVASIVFASIFLILLIIELVFLLTGVSQKVPTFSVILVFLVPIMAIGMMVLFMRYVSIKTAARQLINENIYNLGEAIEFYDLHAFDAKVSILSKSRRAKNKKFQYNQVKPGGRSDTYLGSLQWLEDAGIICRCYNTDITGLPMEGNAKDNVFKVYVADIGLLVQMLGTGTRADILQGNLGGFKGAIFENLMADTLHKKAQSLYYFQKDSGLELDFLVRMDGECVPLEVKAKSSKAKSAKTVLAHPEKYQVKRIIKFGDYNIGREGGLLTLPTYMQFLLDLEPEEIVLVPIDTDELNQLAKQVLDNN